MDSGNHKAKEPEGTVELVVTQKATKTPKSDTKRPPVRVKPPQRVALMPVRYALGNDYIMSGARSLSPKIGGNFQHAPLPANTHTHITLRTLRAGYLYVYNENNRTWNLFKITTGLLTHGGQLILDKNKAPDQITGAKTTMKPVEGVGWQKRLCTDQGIIYVNSDERLWLAYSDSRWTTAIMQKAQNDTAFRQNHMRLFDPKLEGNQPHACAIVGNLKKDGNEKAGPGKVDAAKHVANLHRATQNDAFWFSRHAFEKPSWYNTRSEIMEIPDEMLHGAVIALDDLPGIAMDLGTLMQARLDQFLMRPAKGFLNPNVSYKWALTTGSAIGAIQGIVHNQAMAKKRLLVKGFTVLSGISHLIATGQPCQALQDYNNYKNINATLAASMDKIHEEAWNKYTAKFDHLTHQEWMNTTMVTDMGAFDKEWILPLTKAYVSFVKGKDFKDHFNNVYDPKDVTSGQDFAKTVAQCYLGIQDKAPLKEHMKEELNPKSIEESLLVRALMLNQEESWKGLQMAINEGSLTSKPGDERAKERRTDLVKKFAEFVEGQLVGMMMDPKDIKSKVFAPILAIIGSPLNDLFVHKEGKPIAAGAEAAAIACGKVIQPTTPKGTVGDVINAKTTMSTTLADPNLSPSKVADVAAVAEEYAKHCGVKLSEPAKNATLLLLEKPESPIRASIPVSDVVKKLEELKDVKGATKRFIGLSATLGSILTFASICTLHSSLDKTITAKPEMQRRAWAEFGGALGGVANGIKEAMLRISISAEWIGDLSATHMYTFLKTAGAGLGVAAGLGMAILDTMQGVEEWKKEKFALSVCYFASALIGVGITLVSILTLFGCAAAWIPVAGWILAGLAIITAGLIAYIKDDAIQAWLEKCCWGLGNCFNSFEEESKELQSALAEG